MTESPTLPVVDRLGQGTSAQPSPFRLALLSAETAVDLEAALSALRPGGAGSPAARGGGAVRLHHVGPPAGRHRAGLITSSAPRGAGAAPAEEERAPTSVVEPRDRPVVLMFPGLGDHYVGMGLDLYRSEPTFRAELDRCAEILRPEIGLDIRAVIYPEPPPSAAPAPAAAPPVASRPSIDLRRMLGRSSAPPSEAEARLDHARLGHPALFAVEYALAKVWQRWLPRVDAMIGYSLGEYVSACLAGVLSLEDSLKLVARRAQMLDEIPLGSMLAVGASERQLRPLLGERAELAAVNGPELCVVGGPREDVFALERRLTESGVTSRRVRSSHAFHTSSMSPLVERVARLVRTFTLSPPRIPFWSNVTGARVTAAEATDPAYWAAHLCKPVRFASGIRELLQEPSRIFIEAGPGQTLSSLAILSPREGTEEERVIVPSMRHGYDAQADTVVLLKAVRRLWLAGVALDEARLDPTELRVDAPAASAAPPEARAQPEAPGEAQDAPRTEVEQELAAIWQRLLSAPRVGREDDFFTLGGNSLIATRLVFRIMKSFRVNLPLRRVHETPRLAAMAALISASMASAGEGHPAPPAEGAPESPREGERGS